VVRCAISALDSDWLSVCITATLQFFLLLAPINEPCSSISYHKRHEWLQFYNFQNLEYLLSQPVMSGGRVRSRFAVGSYWTGRSYRRIRTQSISLSVALQHFVTRPIFRSDFTFGQPDLTWLKYYQAQVDRLDAQLDIVMYKRSKSGAKTMIHTLQDIRDVTGILITTRFVVNCLLHIFGSPRWPNPSSLICWIMKTHPNQDLN